MKGIKAIFAAAAVLTAMVNVVPAHAAVQVKVMIAGSSAMWQSMGLGAYNTGACVSGGTKPCHHYTSTGSFNLTDTRPTLVGGTNVTDTGAIWIVWDSAATTHVWAYIKVDSVVGDRCYFAQPRCNVNIATFPAPGNQISSALWGDNSADATPPAAVQALFTAASGLAVNVAATDIRPEDGLFAQCRANSALGGGLDGVDGLGWGTNASGSCPALGAPLSQLVGTDVVSGVTGTVASAHPVAFNISGTDPFSGTAIPAPTTVPVGAAPIVFVTSTSTTTGNLGPVTNATDAQLQTLFSGTNCNASVLTGGVAGNVQVYLREPFSGTMNTTEYTVFRYPNEDGKSQEAGVGAVKLSNTPCTAGGGRTRSIGTGDEIKGVQTSVANTTQDGIGYAFFSYGNVSKLASQAGVFRYLTLNGVDGIFASYAGGDPGEPGNGVIPGATNLPATCVGGFPCPESAIWTGGKSFPHVRDGSYRAWSTLRVVSNGTALTNVKVLVGKSNFFAVQSVPDYIPFSAVKQTVGGVVTTLDPGFLKQRSHYGPGAHNTGTTEAGRDAGGCIQGKGSAVINLVQHAPGKACSTFVPN